jgi:hypothetical protein
LLVQHWPTPRKVAVSPSWLHSVSPHDGGRSSSQKPHPRLLTSASHVAFHLPVQQPLATAQTQASIAVLPQPGVSCDSQHASGSALRAFSAKGAAAAPPSTTTRIVLPLPTRRVAE